MLKKVFSLVLLGVCALGASGVAMTLDEALALYQNDHIAVTFTDEGREQLLDIIATLRATLGVTDALNEENEDRVMEFAVDASLKDVVTKLSQAYYTLANVFYTPETNLPTYLKGKHWGLKSLRMNPGFVAIEGPRSGGKFTEAVEVETDVAAMYWTTANWLRVAQKDKLAAVFASVPAKTQALSERVLALDPGYIAGGSYRSLGAYYSGLPATFGQDLPKALENLCHVVTQPVCSACGDCQPAVAGADAYFENRTFLAEFYYMEKGMWVEAAALLEAVLAEPVGDMYPLMNAYAQWHAQSLLVTVRSHL